jgi:hypothetical protein
MSHDYHEGHANYNKFQLYYDRCAECRWRAEHPVRALEHLKDFRAAWTRAILFEKGRLEPDAAVSTVEVPVLRMLWALAVQFERVGFPIGMFPGDALQVLRATQDPQRAEHAAAIADRLADYHAVACPRGCGADIYGTEADIDSGLRKHLEYCPLPNPEDTES